MDSFRRSLLKAIGAVSAGGALAGGPQEQIATAPNSLVKPRHVLCFLGGHKDLPRLSDAAAAAIKDYATGFSVDQTYSQNAPDPRMPKSFEVCWDRVVPNAWAKSDEEAVVQHKSVLYVLGPSMKAENSVIVSAAALLLVHSLIEAGAVAVKGESAGVAHGVVRWRQLAGQCREALKAGDDIGLSSVCRRAFSKRPLDSDRYFESVGFHLAGLPEVYVSRSYGNALEAALLMDEIADEMAQRGAGVTTKDRQLILSYSSAYAEDDFKYNPYGIAYSNVN
jgi:hypothetical protein